MPFTPPRWIAKTGAAKDLEGGTYDPDNRTITWSIIVNPSGAPLSNLRIEDDLSQAGNPDLIFQSAQWATAPSAIRWDDTAKKWVMVSGGTDVVWSNEGSLLIIEPDDHKTYTYPSSSVSQPVRLTIVSKIPSGDDPVTGTLTYNNTARAFWDGNSTGSNASSGNITVGHAAITKKGDIMPGTGGVPATIKWAVTVDPKK